MHASPITPDLVLNFAAKAEDLGVGHLFTGTRLTSGDPIELASDAQRLRTALEGAVRECFELDGAEAVIIGGGPLGQAADDLQQVLSAPVIAPIRSAVELLLAQIAQSRPAGARIPDGHTCPAPAGPPCFFCCKSGCCAGKSAR